MDNKDCFDVETFDPKDVAKSIMTKINNMEREKEQIRSKKQLLMDKVYKPAKRINKILI